MVTRDVVTRSYVQIASGGRKQSSVCSAIRERELDVQKDVSSVGQNVVVE